MNVIWSNGYFVSNVGINEQTMRKYIDQQGKEDSWQVTFEFYNATGVRDWGKFILLTKYILHDIFI